MTTPTPDNRGAAGEAACYRLHTGEPRRKWQWMDGKPALGVFDLAKLHGYVIEYAYSAPTDHVAQMAAKDAELAGVREDWACTLRAFEQTAERAEAAERAVAALTADLALSNENELSELRRRLAAERTAEELRADVTRLEKSDHMRMMQALSNGQAALIAEAEAEELRGMVVEVVEAHTGENVDGCGMTNAQIAALTIAITAKEPRNG